MKKLTEEEKIARREEYKRRRKEKIESNPELRDRKNALSRAARLRRLANPEYAIRHKERVRERGRRYVSENPEKIKDTAARYYVKNKEKVAARGRDYKKRRKADPEYLKRLREYTAEYDSRPESKAKKSARRKLSWPEQMKNPVNKMLHRAKGRISEIRRMAKLGRIPKTKRSRFEDYFGAEPEIVLQHLSSLFSPEMNWENWGPVWHIDHIIPISLGAQNIELLAKLNHYKNLRPLLASENISKQDKMPDFFPEGVPFSPEDCGWQAPKSDPPAALPVQVEAEASVAATGCKS